MIDKEEQDDIVQGIGLTEDQILAQMTPEDRANAAFLQKVFSQTHLSNNEIAAILRADIENRRSLRDGAKPN
jgi:hypothetical protein